MQKNGFLACQGFVVLLRNVPVGSASLVRVCVPPWGKMTRVLLAPRLFHSVTTCWHIRFPYGFTESCQSCPGDEQMSSDGSDGCLAQDGETLEEDEELKLFIMGQKSMFTKPPVRDFTVDLLLIDLPHRERISRYVEAEHGRRISTLPTRYLPPGNIKMLWLQFGGLQSGISCLECIREGFEIVE